MARQNFLGLVVSQGKMQKTVKVRVERKVFNKRINKELFHRKDYLVHDEGEVSREGDLVRIEATRPLSKRKFFSIAEIIKNKGQQFALFESQAKVNVAKEEAKKTGEFLKRRQMLENDKSVLLEDIRQIQDTLARGESPETLAEIKARYGIESFTPETVKELLQLNVLALEQEVLKQRSKIVTVQARVQELLEDEEASNKFLEGNGVEDPASLKSNIRKNLLRKYVMQQEL
ncbi:LAFE_0C03180g1_1 [Lachancea fermentati]|uniref:LAFE_0C03180g1_1 n=1 Tax=Lachancea fermentati TaxID=4955 RepID=A0A1G4M955_LACFM|nr:LAFE_0C03180g1_1 [Lachancea fermentati]